MSTFHVNLRIININFMKRNSIVYYCCYHCCVTVLGGILLFFISFINTLNLEELSENGEFSRFIYGRAVIDYIFILIYMVVSFLISFVIWKKRITLRYHFLAFLVEFIIYTLIVIWAMIKWWDVLPNYKYSSFV